jgi:hypothetical protein
MFSMQKDNENELDNPLTPNADLTAFAKNPEDIVEEPEIGIQELYEAARHDFTKSYDAPETVLEANGQIWGPLINFSLTHSITRSKYIHS